MTHPTTPHGYELDADFTALIFAPTTGDARRWMDDPRLRRLTSGYGRRVVVTPFTMDRARGINADLVVMLAPATADEDQQLAATVHTTRGIRVRLGEPA